MRRSILVLAVLCTVGFVLPKPLFAQETQPGDACAAGLHVEEHVSYSGSLTDIGKANFGDGAENAP